MMMTTMLIVEVMIIIDQDDNDVEVHDSVPLQQGLLLIFFNITCITDNWMPPGPGCSKTD